MQMLERTEGEQIEDRTQVHIEPFEPLPSEYRLATGQMMHSRLTQVSLIVGRGTDANVDGRTGQPGRQHSLVASPAIIDHFGHRIELSPIPILLF